MSLRKELEIDEERPTTISIGEDDETDSSEGGDEDGYSAEGEAGGSERNETSAKEDKGPRVVNADPAKRSSRGSPNRPSKGGRWRDLQNDLRSSRDTIKGFEAKFAQLEATISRLQTASTPAQHQAAQEKATGQESDLVKEMNMLVEQAGDANLSPDRRAWLSSRYQELQDKRQELRWETQSAAREARLREEIKREVMGSLPGGGNPQVAGYTTALQQEFPELMGNDDARASARDYYSALVRAGRPEGLPLLREAAAHIASVMGLGGRAPSPRTRAAYAGVPGRRTGGGSDQRELTASDKRVISQALNAGIPEQYLKKAIAGDGDY